MQTGLDKAILAMLKAYYEDLNKRYDKLSKDFFAKKRIWREIYKSDISISLCDKRFPEYLALVAAQSKRQELGLLRKSIRHLINMLEGDTDAR